MKTDALAGDMRADDDEPLFGRARSLVAVDFDALFDQIDVGLEVAPRKRPSVTGARPAARRPADKAPRPVVKADALSHKQIDLTWQPVPDAMAYLIERCQPDATKNGFVQVATVPAATCYHSDTRLFSATGYQYRIKAVYATGKVGPYSAVTKAKTRTRPLALKRQLDEVKARLARDPNDTDALCHLKAIDAATSLYGWGERSELRAIDGYIAAKEALPRHNTNDGALAGYLYAAAKHAAQNAERDELVIRMTGMPRIHNSAKERAEQRDTASWHLRSPASIDERRETKYGVACLGDTLRAPSPELSLALALEQALNTLSLSDRELIEKRLEGATVEELSKDVGVSVATVERRLNHAEQKLKELFAHVDSST